MPLTPFIFNLDDQVILEFVIRNRDGTPYDLSTANSVVMLVEGVDEFTCAITDATAGEASRTVDEGDFVTGGSYRCQLRVEDGGLTFHTDVFHVQVGEVIDTTPTVPITITPPTGNPTEGIIPYGDTGGGSYTEDPSNLMWDATKKALLIGGATAGGSFNKGIALKDGTFPTTSITDVVQIVADDIDGAGTVGLKIRDEIGGEAHIGSFVDTDVKLRLVSLNGDEVVLRTGSGENVLESSADPFVVRLQGTNTISHSIANTTIASTGTVKFRVNDSATTVYVGSGSTPATVGGTISSSVTTTGTPANTTETVLHSHSIPANTLSTDRAGLRFWFIGTLAANGNNKTVRLKLGGTGGTLIVDSGTVATNNGEWRIDGTLIRTAANAVTVQGQCMVGPAGAASGATSTHRFNTVTVTPDLTGAVTLDLTGQNGSASANDIQATCSKVVFEDA